MTKLCKHDGHVFYVPRNMTRVDDANVKGWRVHHPVNKVFSDLAYGGIWASFAAAKSVASKIAKPTPQLITKDTLVDGVVKRQVFATIAHPAAKMNPITRYVGVEGTFSTGKAAAKLAEVRRLRNQIVAQYRN